MSYAVLDWLVFAFVVAVLAVALVGTAALAYDCVREVDGDGGGDA